MSDLLKCVIIPDPVILGPACRHPLKIFYDPLFYYTNDITCENTRIPPVRGACRSFIQQRVIKRICKKGVNRENQIFNMEL